MTPLIPVIIGLILFNAWQTAKAKGLIKSAATSDRASEEDTSIRDVERDTEMMHVDRGGHESGTPANRMPEFRGVAVAGTMITIPVPMKLTRPPHISFPMPFDYPCERVPPETASHLLSNEPHSEPVVLDQRGAGVGASLPVPTIPDTDEHIIEGIQIEREISTIMPVYPEITLQMPPRLTPSPDIDVSMTEKAPSKLIQEPDEPPLPDPKTGVGDMRVEP